MSFEDWWNELILDVCGMFEAGFFDTFEDELIEAEIGKRFVEIKDVVHKIVGVGANGGARRR